MNVSPRLFVYLSLGVLQFFILTIICMFLYQGGNIIDHSAGAYSFTLNYFSDLGRTTTFTGAPNVPVYIIFSFSAVGVGVSAAFFFFFFPGLFDGKSSRLLVRVGMVTGMLSGICFIGVGLTPWDIQYPMHIYFVKLGFSLFLMASVCCSIAMYRYPDYPNRYVVVYGIFILILSAYLYLLFLGPKDKTSLHDMSLQVISQKIVLYSQMTCMWIQAVGAYRLADKKLRAAA